jgi:hypothetical protein
MSAPKQRNEFDGKPTLWEILYFCLALDCDFPILEAITKSIYSTTITSKGTVRKYRNGILYYKKYTNGNKIHYKADQIHREDGPAIEYVNGYKEWRRNGELHREDGPAIEYPNGDNVWYRNGQRDRKDGPAAEYASGYKEWRRNGELHREDGPAVEYAYGHKEWRTPTLVGWTSY